jgi:sugar lactone lactonase YvrE
MPSFLIGALLLPLVIFFAWTASRSANPAGTAVAVRRNDPPLASGRAVSYSTAGQPGVQIVLKYGRAEGEIGMVLGHGQPPVGPESFAVGKDGGILVADVVNQRVVVYSSNGAYLRTIDLPGIALGDVTADAQGGLYVYDQVRHALHQYHADGTLRSTLNLNPADIDTRGYFHVAGNAFYFADAAARDVLVATLQDGLLAPPDKALERTTDGIHGESGRIYSMSVDKGQALRLQVRDPAAQSVARSVEVPLPGIVSARYAGEDQAQRFYVQTERLAGTSIVLEVLAFSRAGEQLAATRMPENDYAIWTAKLVDVRTDGTIVQFLPQQTQAKLNLFAN